MATENLFGSLNLGAGWAVVNNLQHEHGIYFIGVKGTASPEDVCDISKVKKVVLALGINSAVVDETTNVIIPITIQTIVLDFDSIIDVDSAIEEHNIAVTRVNKLPTPLYIKVLSIFDDKKEYKGTGTIPIGINALPF